MIQSKHELERNALIIIKETQRKGNFYNALVFYNHQLVATKSITQETVGIKREA